VGCAFARLPDAIEWRDKEAAVPHETPSLPQDLAPRDFRCYCDLEPRFRDLDAMGHVNNAVYFTYLEMARTAYMRALGPEWAEATEDFGARYPFILVSAECQYRSAVRQDDRLRVYVRAAHLGSKSFHFQYLVCASDGRVVALGRTVQLAYDYAAGATRPLPPELRAAFNRVEADGAHLR